MRICWRQLEEEKYLTEDLKEVILFGLIGYFQFPFTI